jgi:hypothetical protein
MRPAEVGLARRVRSKCFSEEEKVSVVMPPARHPESMKTGSSWFMLAGDDFPDKVGISLVL